MYKKLFLTVYLLVFAHSLIAQRILTRQDYVDRFSKMAVIEMYRSGVPASITLAQGCLESGNGNSELSQKSNNHFGIKCHGWAGDGVYYDDDARGECFRKYNSVLDSYADHSDFLSRNSRYAFLFDLKITDYKAWARGLKKAGYATDPHYADKLIKIIEENELHKYDKMSPKDFKSKVQEEVVEKPKTTSVGGSSPSITPQSSTIIYKNGIKATKVRAGDSLKSIADKNGLKLWEVYQYNDFTNDYRIQIGELIYLQQKKRKAEKNYNYHIVKSGESMHSISQQYGIQLRRLYKLNRLDVSQNIKVGQRLYLRKKAPR